MTAPIVTTAAPGLREVELVSARVAPPPPGRLRAVGRVLQHVTFAIAVLAAWEFVSGRLISPLVISSPSRVLEAAIEWTAQGYLQQQVWSTLSAVVIGFVAGTIVAFLIAVLFTQLPRLGRFGEPYLLAAGVIPAVALVPVFVIWLGLGPQVKVVMGAWSAFSIIFITCYQGLRNADAQLLELARSYGAARRQQLFTVRIWAALPFLASGAKLALPKTVLAVVVTEFIAGNSGLGFAILRAGNNLDTGGLFLGVVVLTGLTLGLSWALLALERVLLRWVPRERR